MNMIPDNEDHEPTPIEINMDEISSDTLQHFLDEMLEDIDDNEEQ